MTHIDNQGAVSNLAVNQYIYGGQYFGVQHPDPTRREDAVQNYDLGLRLGNAPQINEEDFVGRDRELEQLRAWLAPRLKRQNVVAIYGLGGIGKTQLSIHFARRFADTYTSLFWLNAKDESTLRAGLAALAAQVTEDSMSPAVTDPHKEEWMVHQARQWLSRPGNDRWLVVYDNYDDPRLPGIDSSTGYDIRDFFPQRVHGSILITTRSPRLTFAKQLRLGKLDNISQNLTILATRSGREVKEDPDATTLARRLDGLPLALATAGTYLSQTADSFGNYLQLYNDSWNDLDEHGIKLLDYEDRTLYSTWNLSLTRVRSLDPAAAVLLRLMAYLDNQDLWYELFQAGAEDKPLLWSEVVKSRARFNRAMSTLHDYSLVDVRGGSYSLHTCVHDWILECLNHDFDSELCRVAIHCIAKSVKWKTEVDYWVTNRRVLQHAHRLEHAQLKALIDWDGVELRDLYKIANLFWQGDMNVAAEEMYMRALRGYEKIWGVEHTSTLDTVNNLGVLYADQGKMAEAEEMYIRALRGREKAWGVEHTSTLGTVNNLGLLYADQGKMAEAEEMYIRALRGREKAWGVEHMSTLATVNNLGVLYANQGKMAEAEEMYMRALQGYKKAMGVDHPKTQLIACNLNRLHAND